MMVLMLEHIKIKADLIKDEKYQSLFTVESVNKLVWEGMSFRDAYKVVANQIEESSFKADNQISHTHKGSVGNLCTEEIKGRFYGKLKIFR